MGLSEGMDWIRSKDCHGLIEMEKGKLKRELISKLVEKFNEMWYKIATVMSNWSVGSEYSFKAEQHVEINDILDIFKRELKEKLK